MHDGIINFVQDIRLPGFSDHPFVGMIIRGRTFMIGGETKIDSHILNYCPGCGKRFSDFIDGYAPPLVVEKFKKKPDEPKLII